MFLATITVKEKKLSRSSMNEFNLMSSLDVMFVPIRPAGLAYKCLLQ